jgi:hypothetical protein
MEREVKPFSKRGSWSSATSLYKSGPLVQGFGAALEFAWLPRARQRYLFAATNRRLRNTGFIAAN